MQPQDTFPIDLAGLPAAPRHAAGFEVVVIAASAGGIRALRQVLAALPADFPAAVAVVQHRAADGPGHLAPILAQHCALPVREARDGDRLAPGVVYVAPADRHLLATSGGALALHHGDKVNCCRPAADPLFHSVAACHGDRAIALVLTGRGVDAAEGARAVRQRGGVVLVQDPATCDAPAMPLGVLARGGADFVLPLDKIADALCTLVMSPAISTALFGLPRAVA